MYGKSRKKRAGSESPAKDATIRLITVNNRRFVAGLEWQTIKAHRKVMSTVRKIGKERNLDVVAIRSAEAIQAGFAPKSRLKLRGAYSLIVSLASLLDGCCIAVIPLGQNDRGEDEFTLVGRTEKGAIHSDSDAIHLASDIKQVVLDLKQDLQGNRHNIDIPIYGDPDIFPWVTDVLDLNEILKPSNIRKDFRLKPLQWGMTKGQLIGLGSALILSVIAVIFFLNYMEEQSRLEKIRIQVLLKEQEELNKKARYQAALSKFIHPWIKTSSIPVFLKGCNEGLKKLPLSIEGWTPAMIKCSQEGISVNYNRPDNSAVTAERFVAAVKRIYGTDPEFSITQTSMSAFFIAHELQPNGDDPFQPMGEQLLKIVSLFQSVNIPASLNEVSIKDVKQNDQGENLPLQDWREFTFDVDTSIPPELIFKSGEYTGMRLNSIIYEISQDKGSVSYKLSGTVYGKRNL